jgi:hypothetical protein
VPAALNQEKIMRSLLLALTLLLAVPAGAGEVIGPSKCIAAKLKAGGAYAQALASCRSKAAAKGVPVDLACETKALARLQKAFEKAEAKGDCIVTGDVASFQGESIAYVGRLLDVVSQVPRCCSRSTGGAGGPYQCFFTLTDDECHDQGGAWGAVDDACGDSGQCEPAGSVALGACCEHEGTCLAGAVGEPECTTLGGTYTASGALCSPTGECEVAQ